MTFQYFCQQIFTHCSQIIVKVTGKQLSMPTLVYYQLVLSNHWITGLGSCWAGLLDWPLNLHCVYHMTSTQSDVLKLVTCLTLSSYIAMKQRTVCIFGSFGPKDSLKGRPIIQHMELLGRLCNWHYSLFLTDRAYFSHGYFQQHYIWVKE